MSSAPSTPTASTASGGAGISTGAWGWAKRRAGGIGPPLIAGLVIVALWEGLLGWLQPDGFLLPPPSRIVAELLENRSQVFTALQTTGFVVITGLAIGIALGVVAALLVSRWRTAAETITPLAAALNAMPIIAVAPIFNAWFGTLAPRSNQAVVIVVVFFPVFIGTAKGLSQVDDIHLELMDSLAASRWRIMREVRIPNALPYLFTAAKVTSSLAVIAAIVAEYFGGRQDALGPLIVQSAGLSRYATAWAGVAAGAALGIGLYLLVTLIERLSIPWAMDGHATNS
ncbi:ABC transporter permease [soil metagenome]